MRLPSIRYDSLEQIRPGKHRCSGPILLVCVACASASSADIGPVQADVAITGVAVVDVEKGKILQEQTVVIAGNRIAQFGIAPRFTWFDPAVPHDR